MQRGKTAHRQADNMRSVDLESIDYGLYVVASASLRVFLGIIRYVGGRIAPCIERNAAIPLAKVTHLRFPRSAVACKFVDKDDRNARSDLFVKELYVVVGSEIGHAATPQNHPIRA